MQVKNLEQEIEKLEYKFGENRKVIVRKIFYGNKNFIDVRIWKIFSGEQDFKPTKQGIMLEPSDFFGHLLPMMIKMQEIDKSS